MIKIESVKRERRKERDIERVCACVIEREREDKGETK